VAAHSNHAREDACAKEDRLLKFTLAIVTSTLLSVSRDREGLHQRSQSIPTKKVSMGQQYNKTIKRRRRRDYLKRRKERLLNAAANSTPKAKVKKAAKKAVEKKAPAKKTVKKAAKKAAKKTAKKAAKKAVAKAPPATTDASESSPPESS